MNPLSVRTDALTSRALSDAEDAIARSVLFAALFDYPLTLAQLRQTLIGSRQTASEILASVRDSAALHDLVESRDGFFFPAGCAHLIGTRRHREARSIAFLAEHRVLLRVISACPFIRFVALSGSIAHLNLEAGGDLDLFIVTRGPRVWSAAVFVVLLAKLMGRRRTLCANFIVADTDLSFAEDDLFTASQIVGLRPVTNGDFLHDIVAANPFVRRCYPNFHPAASAQVARRARHAAGRVKGLLETILAVPSLAVERVCRWAYRTYLRRRSATWKSPEQVVLGDRILKLHTRSHRRDTLNRFATAVRHALDE